MSILPEPVLRRQLLFASPVFLSRPPGQEGLRQELRDTLLAEAAGAPGVVRSNVGGWHSPSDLLERPQPCFQALGKLMLAGFREVLRKQAEAQGKVVDPAMRIGGSAWAMVMGPGDYSQPHHHGDAHWAGVYYVDVGDQPPETPAPAGFLSFLDPRGPLKGGDPLELFSTRQDLRPVDGLLVFFPGWLQHHVHPYKGVRKRVSISCNLVVG